MALPRVVAVSLAQKFDIFPVTPSSRIRTRIVPTGVWYAPWYSIFCTIENRRIPRWLRILFNAGQGTIPKKFAPKISTPTRSALARQFGPAACQDGASSEERTADANSAGRNGLRKSVIFPTAFSMADVSE